MRALVRHLSYVTSAIGLTLLVPAVISLIYGEYYESSCFLTLSIITISTSLLVRSSLRASAELTYIEVMAVASFAWILASSIGLIPYVLIAGMTPVDALFESMSGFTTTGLTLMENMSAHSRGLLFWRAFTQWIGGISIILLYILLMPESGLGIGVLRLYRVEGRSEVLAYGVKGTAIRLLLTYSLYTVMCCLMLLLVGLSPFEALAHAFTALSTGGFSVRDESVGAYRSPYVEAIIMAFMVIGAISFLTHGKAVLERRVKAFLENVEVTTLLTFVTIFVAIATLDLAAHNGWDFMQALRLSSFNVISALTGTGFTSANVVEFPPLTKGLLTTLMAVGGCVGSTSGGVKIIRVMLLLSLLRHTLIKAVLPPEAVKVMKIKRQVVSDDEVMRAASFCFMYLLMLMAISAILIVHGLDMFSAISTASSAQGTVGISFIKLHVGMPMGVKMALTFGMWAGRLELIPVLILFMPRTWKELLALRRRRP